MILVLLISEDSAKAQGFMSDFPMVPSYDEEEEEAEKEEKVLYEIFTQLDGAFLKFFQS